MYKYTCFSSYRRNTYQFAFSPFLLFILTSFLLLTACAESNTSNTSNTPTNVPDSKQLLKQAQDAMKQVNSYHFNLTADRPGNINGIAIQQAEGDVLAPDKIKAKSSITFQGFPVPEINIIAIGQKDYYTDPLTGNWKTANGVVDAQKIADQQAGIGTLLGNIQQPGKATDSSVDGNSCWSITGQLSTQDLASIVGNLAGQNGNVNTTVCIGKADHRLYQVQLNGSGLQGDSAQTTRSIKLSKFNQAITIEAPQV